MPLVTVDQQILNEFPGIAMSLTEFHPREMISHAAKIFADDTAVRRRDKQESRKSFGVS